MSAESKRRWRVRNSERYAEYERKRAQARRSGWWGAMSIGSCPADDARECASSSSYYRYERSAKRMIQKMNHARWGSDWRRAIELPERERLQLLTLPLIADALAQLHQ